MPTIQETFGVVCQLAKNKNQYELEKVIDEALLAIDFCYGLYTPIMRLAEDGEREAVNFLLNHFDANQDGALEGYARGGFNNDVDLLLRQGAKVGFAVRGTAWRGDHHRTQVLMANQRPYAVQPFAIAGYAMGGFVANVNELLTLTKGNWIYLRKS